MLFVFSEENLVLSASKANRVCLRKRFLIEMNIANFNILIRQARKVNVDPKAILERSAKKVKLVMLDCRELKVY